VSFDDVDPSLEGILGEGARGKNCGGYPDITNGMACIVRVQGKAMHAWRSAWRARPPECMGDAMGAMQCHVFRRAGMTLPCTRALHCMARMAKCMECIAKFTVCESCPAACVKRELTLRSAK
jgi:hypothetical protein